jgi:hypothetical protein
MKCAVFEILNYQIINTLNMKNRLWKTIKSRRFLYALLTAVLLYAFAVGSSRLWAYLIPCKLLEVVVWFVVYFGLLAIVLWNWDDWFDNGCV